MNYEKPENINQRTFKFAIKVISFCKMLPKDEVNRILINQLIRSVTSVGANLEEASGARTRAEFINCNNIARREARETYYWLKMIYEVNSQQVKDKMESILIEANEIVSILTASVKKLQQKN